MRINKYTYVCVCDVPASRGNICPRDVLVVASLRVSKYVLFACNTIVLQYCRLILLTACLFSCRQDRTGQKDGRMYDSWRSFSLCAHYFFCLLMILRYMLENGHVGHLQLVRRNFSQREKVLVRQSHDMGVRDGWFEDRDIFEYNKSSWVFSPLLACCRTDLKLLYSCWSVFCLSVCLSVCWCC